MLKDKKLVLVFTLGMSLKKWSEGGMLFREVGIYNELAKYFSKIYFLSYGDVNNNLYENFLFSNINVLVNKKSRNALIYSFLAPFIHRKAMKEADIFKTNQMLGSWTAVIAKILFRKKLIVRQGYQLSLFYGMKQKYICKFISSFIELVSYRVADKIIVTTREDKDYITKRYRIQEEKIQIMPNYVDTDTFKPLGLEKERQVIFVGRLDEQKNLAALIDAVKSINVKLVLIGDGPLEDMLKTKVMEEGIGNVVFRGVLPNEQLPVELNKAKIFILPSLYEGNPKTLLEAMACGLPVIGTNVVGIKEVITHGENGYLCDTSVESLKEAITTVMARDELRDTLGYNARKTILVTYALDVLAKNELDMLEKTVHATK